MNAKQDQSPIVRVGRYAAALAVVWTAVLAASLTFSLIQDKQETTDLARSQARIALEKDILYRRWNAGFGGVYVPVTSTTLPNPYLGVAERDVTTSAGRRLTLINPAYMTRQVHELAAQQSGALGHITSLKPIRLENAPDPWERQALEAFERGTMEVSSIETINGKPSMRLMRPLVTEKACLKCHAAQGYREGEIRGGISVSIPMATLWAVVKFTPVTLALSHGAFWVVGLGGIALSARGIRRRAAERTRAEEALCESEELYRSLVENIDQGITLVDKDHKIVMTNAAIGRMFHKATGEFLGKYCFQEFEKRPTVCAHCPGTKTLATGKPHSAETEGVRDDGSRFTVQIHAFPVHGRDGSVTAFIEVVEDITERKRADEALRDSEARYRALFEKSTDGILIADMETRTLKYANPAICRMLGYTEEELRTMGVADIHPKEALQSVMAEFEAQARGDKTLAVNLPCLRKDGTILYADINAGTITIDGWVCNVGLFRDVTERKRAADALKESEERFRVIVESVGMGVVMLNRQMELVQMNRTMRQWFPDADASGTPLCYKALVTPPRDSPCPDCPAFLTHQDGRVHEGLRTVTRAGKSLHLRIRSSPVHDANNQVIGSIEVVEDVTRQEISRRRIEAAAQLVSQISPIGDRTRLLDLVIQRATDLLEADFGVIVELDSVTGAIGAAYPAKFPLSRVPAGTQVRGQGMLGRIAGGEAVWTADITAEPGYVGYPSWHPRVGPCIGLPLRLLGTILGIMLVGREKGKPPFTEEDTNYARTLAHHAAVGIDRTRRMEALHALSLIDQLTGLKNRRGFLLLAEQQMKMASRVKRGLWLLFVDLDGLKWINDNLGHGEGDQALIAAADVLRGTFRESDVMARMGGDEFAVLAVETTQTNAEPLEVRLQKNIEAWNDHEHRSYSLSVSVGAVRYDPESPCSLEELLTQADRLMYEQKRNKRTLSLERLAQDECGE